VITPVIPTDTLKKVLIYKLKLKLLLFKNTIFYNKKLNIIIYLYIDNLIIINSNKKLLLAL